MWTRSAKNEAGKFSFTCTDWNGNQFSTGEFDTAHNADRAGENAERLMTMAMMSGEPVMTLDQVLTEMSDDELLRELGE